METVIEVGHEFTEEEIEYIESNGITLEEVEEFLSTIEDAEDRPTIETVIGSIKKDQMDDSEPVSEEDTESEEVGKTESETTEE